MSKYSEVIELIRSEHITLFIGSGCSIASGAPKADDLAIKFFDMLPPILQNDLESEKGCLAKMGHALVTNDNSTERRDAVIKKLYSNLLPGEFHKKLAKVPQIHSIVTTNYDTLIEDSFNSDRIVVIRRDQDCVNINPSKTNLFKIHGDVVDLDDIILGSEDYRKADKFDKQPLLWKAVETELCRNSIVFIGYSFEDSNIQNLIDEIKERTKESFHDAFLICPYINHLKEIELQQLGIKYIEGYDIEFINETIEEINAHFADDLKNKRIGLGTSCSYAVINNLCFDVRDDGKECSASNWKRIDGEPTKTTINIEFKKKDLTLDSEMIIDGFSVPAISLSNEEIQSADIRVDGIQALPNDALCFKFGPMVNKCQLTLVDSKFNRVRSDCISYNIGERHIIKLNPGWGIIEVSTAIHVEGLPTIQNMSLHMNSTLSDLDNAIKWLEILKRMAQGEKTVIIENQTKYTIERTLSEALPWFETMLQYFINIKEIELLSGVVFNEYNGYTEDRFLDTKKVLSYLKKQPFIERLEGYEENFSIILPNDESLVPGNHYVMRAVKAITEPVLINGVPFSLPEERLLYMKSQLIKKEKIEGNRIKAYFTVRDTDIQIEYNDPDDHDIMDKVSQEEPIIV